MEAPSTDGGNGGGDEGGCGGVKWCIVGAQKRHTSHSCKIWEGFLEEAQAKPRAEGLKVSRKCCGVLDPADGRYLTP